MSQLRSTRPVLVTGASTGIGRATVERLAGLGYPVFATARKEADLVSLGKIGNVTPVRLDVRNSDDVAAALERVRSAGRGLYALVNNAGVGSIGPLTAFTDDEIRDLFEVNVFGVVRMIRAFLPLLFEARGRIVIIGSQGGSISMKYYGPYTMTKHALEAMAIALDDEVRPHGVSVSILQPGGVVTAIGANSAAADEARFRRAGPPFDVEAKAILSMPEGSTAFDPHQPESASNRNPAPPEAVADRILETLEATAPPLRTLIGSRWEGNRVLDALMQRIAQANACPSLAYGRDDLLQRLARFLDGAGR